MTETEIQKLFAYQYGLLNNNLVMTKQDFIEMIENLPDDAELVVSNYTIGFVVTDVEYNELWNQIRLSGE